MAHSATPTSFKKGKSGNPRGRPKQEYSITQTLKDMMTERPEVKRSIATRIFNMALKGNFNAIKLLWNYMDGMPMQTTDITSGGQPVNVKIVDYGTGNSNLSTEEAEGSTGGK